MARIEFVHLILQYMNKADASVVVQKPTADYFGWTDAFPHYLDPRPGTDDVGKRRFRVSLSNDPRKPGGQRLYICRNKSKMGFPAGETHCFRMRGPWSRKHLVMLAEAAGDKFEWMEGQYGARISRSDWESLWSKDKSSQQDGGR